MAASLDPHTPPNNNVYTYDDDNEAVFSDNIMQVGYECQQQASHHRKSSLVDRAAVAASGGIYVHSFLAHNDSSQQTIRNDRETSTIQDTSFQQRMTKAKLFDMIASHRALATKLSITTLRHSIRRILVLTKPHDDSLLDPMRTLCTWLVGEGYKVYIEASFSTNPEFKLESIKGPGELRYWTVEGVPKVANVYDFVVTLGGDGTVLYASWLFQGVTPPVLSFSFGSLGFMTKFDFEQHEATLTQMFTTGFTIGLRLRFDVTIMRAIKKDGAGEGEEGEEGGMRNLTNEILHSVDGESTHKPDASWVILNDVVVDRGEEGTMSNTDLYIDDEFITHVAADGIIVSTPTGSTAYSLSAGGALCHPELSCFVICPICPHSLTFRPIMIPSTKVIRVGVPYDGRNLASVSFDGRERCKLMRGDYVTIVASCFPFPVCQKKPDNKDWFDGIQRTLGWGGGERVQQKAFA